VQIIKAEDYDPNFVPICPHCSQEINTILRLGDEKGWFQGHLGYCFACPHCRKVLGFADYSSS